MKRTEAQRERYAECKRLGLCVDCRAGLSDDDRRRIRCVECRERQAKSDLKRTGRRGAMTPQNRQRRNERLLSRYQRQKLAGLCVATSCCKPALDDNVRCAEHRDASRAASLRYFYRRRLSTPPAGSEVAP